MFTAPQKLIQKRYDKLLDYCCRLERSSSVSSSSSSSTSSPASDPPPGPAKRDYEAINALLVEELQRFNMAAYIILTNCVVCLAALLRGLMGNALVGAPAVHQLPVRIAHITHIILYSFNNWKSIQASFFCFLQPPLSNITEVQNSIMDELNNLMFVKDNAQKLMERKVSFERQRDKKTVVRP